MKRHRRFASLMVIILLVWTCIAVSGCQKSGQTSVQNGSSSVSLSESQDQLQTDESEIERTTQETFIDAYQLAPPDDSGFEGQKDGEWVIVKAFPRPISDLWASSAQDIFVVGSVIYHFDGTDWREMRSGTPYGLYCVWGNSATDVYAAGRSGTLVHYDGSTWTQMDFPTKENLIDIWSPGPGEVYVISDLGRVIHGVNGQWTVPLEFDGSFYCMWGTSATDLFVSGIGSLTTQGGEPELANRSNSSGVIYHFDGTDWTRTWLSDQYPSQYDTFVWGVTQEDKAYHLNAIWGSSPQDVFCVGASYSTHIILHYDGQRWTQMKKTAGDNDGRGGLYSGFSFSPDDAFTGGENNRLFRYDGQHWSWSSNKDEFHTPLAFSDLWGVAEPRTVLAIGGGMLFQYWGDSEPDLDKTLYAYPVYTLPEHFVQPKIPDESLYMIKLDRLMIDPAQAGQMGSARKQADDAVKPYIQMLQGDSLLPFELLEVIRQTEPAQINEKSWVWSCQWTHLEDVFTAQLTATWENTRVDWKLSMTNLKNKDSRLWMFGKSAFDQSEGEWNIVENLPVESFSALQPGEKPLKKVHWTLYPAAEESFVSFNLKNGDYFSYSRSKTSEGYTVYEQQDSHYTFINFNLENNAGRIAQKTSLKFFEPTVWHYWDENLQDEILVPGYSSGN